MNLHNKTSDLGLVSLREISQQLSMPLSTVGMHWDRAVSKIAHKIDPEHFLSDNEVKKLRNSKISEDRRTAQINKLTAERLVVPIIWQMIADGKL